MVPNEESMVMNRKSYHLAMLWVEFLRESSGDGLDLLKSYVGVYFAG